MHAYTSKEKQEVAGFLVRALHGGVGIVSPILGAAHSVELKPHEILHKGEQYLGSSHAHPNSNDFSIWDVGTFLADPTERISMVIGADGSNSLLIKTDKTQPLGITELEDFKKAYEQDEIPDLATQRGFLFYKGKGSDLELLNKDARPKNGTVKMDEFVKDVKGLDQIPSTIMKKVKMCLERMGASRNMGLLDSRNFYAQLSPKPAGVWRTVKTEDSSKHVFIRDREKELENRIRECEDAGQRHEAYNLRLELMHTKNKGLLKKLERAAKDIEK